MKEALEYERFSSDWIEAICTSTALPLCFGEDFIGTPTFPLTGRYNNSVYTLRSLIDIQRIKDCPPILSRAFIEANLNSRQVLNVRRHPQWISFEGHYFELSVAANGRTMESMRFPQLALENLFNYQGDIDDDIVDALIQEAGFPYLTTEYENMVEEYGNPELLSELRRRLKKDRLIQWEWIMNNHINLGSDRADKAELQIHFHF